MNFVKVATTIEIAPGQARLVDVEGRSIALFNVGGLFFAIDNTVTHHGCAVRVAGSDLEVEL